MLGGVDPAASPGAFRIGDFVFAPATGEVRPATPSSGAGGVRLPPQPSRLLELLIEKHGELATREEIRALLWPETHVDFDQGLHFCVRQIRTAFGDSASEPAYIETLPRRGYRLMRPAEPVEPPRPAGGEDGEAPPSPVSARRSAGWPPVAVAGLLILLLAAGLGLARACRAPDAAGPIRLAIMPFELAAEGGESDRLARLSEWLVAEFSGGWGGKLDVVGPRSTAAYSAFPFPDLDRLADDLAVDYVLNARFFDRDGESQLIVELIRLDDGTHPWAEFFPDAHSWEAIAREVRDDVAGALRLPPRPRPTAQE